MGGLPARSNHRSHVPQVHNVPEPRILTNPGGAVFAFVTPLCQDSPSLYRKLHGHLLVCAHASLHPMIPGRLL